MHGVKQKGYSREGIVRLMGQLPSKVECLLRDCVGTAPYFIPNYATFNSKGSELLKPFFEYSDMMFHAGNYSEVFRSAVRIFAAKKMEYEHFLRKKSKQIEESDGAKIFGTFMRFKLLLDFFGYTESEFPSNMFRIFDLEYRFENEKDPIERQEFLESISKLVKESSTALFVQALLALNEGDLDRALALCNEAFKKFPGNTPVYRLKADVLQAIANKTIEEGLKQEPKDRALRLARDIEHRLWKLRKECAKGIVDPEVAIETLERLVQDKIKREGIELKIYEREVEKCLQSTEVAQPRSIRFLCTGEFLLIHLHTRLDYAPSAIEFCKAVENELCEHVFNPFKSWCLKNIPNTRDITEKSEPLFRFVYEGKSFTLGSMAIVLRLLRRRKLLRKNKLLRELRNLIDSFPQPEFLLGTNGVQTVLTPQTVNRYRNSAAHLSEFTLEKALETKKWCYQILNLLACARAYDRQLQMPIK